VAGSLTSDNGRAISGDVAVADMEADVVSFIYRGKVVESEEVGNISFEGIVTAIGAESPGWIVGCINVETKDNWGNDKGTEWLWWFGNP